MCRKCHDVGMDVRKRNRVSVTGRKGGPVVVLAHGFGCDQNLWRLVVPELEKHFRVVLFDHVGAGGPTCPPGVRSGTPPWTATSRT